MTRAAVTKGTRAELEGQLQAIEDWAQRKHTTQVDPPDPRWSTALGEVRVRDASLNHDLEEEQARVAELEAKLARLRDTDECWVAKPGEGTLECRHDRLCPTCRVRNAEAESSRLREENRRLAELALEAHRLLVAVRQITIATDELWFWDAKERWLARWPEVKP